jgi:hypothetical protein
MPGVLHARPLYALLALAEVPQICSNINEVYICTVLNTALEETMLKRVRGTSDPWS